MTVGVTNTEEKSRNRITAHSERGKVGEVGMIREYIIKTSDEIMEEEISDRPQELVRCKDCKHSMSYENGFYGCGKGHGLQLGDWFCADGERK